MKQVYLIKNLTPWMITELLAFSQFVSFSLILLRNPSNTLNRQLEVLREKNIDIYVKPFSKFPNIRRWLFSLRFILSKLNHFHGKKNFIFGVKSVLWFTKIQKYAISENTSIHAQFATQATIIALMYKQYFSNIEYSFTFHAHDIYYRNRWFNDLVKDSNVAFSISDFNIDYVMQYYQNLETHKFKVSRLGVFLHNPISKVKNKTLTIGFLSWWEEKKGLFVLLNSIKTLKNQISIRVILAGDGTLKERAHNFINSNSLTEFCIDMGSIFGDEKEIFFRDIDVFCLPSISVENDMDGIPVVLMEALSYSVPIITTEISGIPEICSNGVNGILIPPNNTKALVKALEKFNSMNNQDFRAFKKNAYLSCKKYDIVQNSKQKLIIMGWN